jgi:hypothetical protein
LDEDGRALIDEFKANGVLDAFLQALTSATGHVPAAAGRYFLNWLKAAEKVSTPQFALRQCLLDEEKDAAGDLELWSFQYVALVVADGAMRHFIPMSLVKGKRLEGLAPGAAGLEVRRHYANVGEWVKTRNGYVAGRGALFDAIKSRAAGDFARATGNY